MIILFVVSLLIHNVIVLMDSSFTESSFNILIITNLIKSFLFFFANSIQPNIFSIAYAIQPNNIKAKNGIMGIPMNGKNIKRITRQLNFLNLPLIAVQRKGLRGTNIKVVKMRSVSLYPFLLTSMHCCWTNQFIFSFKVLSKQHSILRARSTKFSKLYGQIRTNIPNT